MPRILIAKIAAMGDVIMASAMLPAIHTAWPGAHVTWLTDTALAPLVRRFDGVDEIILIPAGKLLVGNAWDRAVSLANRWKSLGLCRWDTGIVAHAGPRYRLLVAGACIASLTVQPTVRSGTRQHQ